MSLLPTSATVLLVDVSPALFAVNPASGHLHILSEAIAFVGQAVAELEQRLPGAPVSIAACSSAPLGAGGHHVLVLHALPRDLPSMAAIAEWLRGLKPPPPSASPSLGPFLSLAQTIFQATPAEFGVAQVHRLILVTNGALQLPPPSLPLTCKTPQPIFVCQVTSRLTCSFGHVPDDKAMAWMCSSTGGRYFSQPGLFSLDPAITSPSNLSSSSSSSTASLIKVLDVESPVPGPLLIETRLRQGFVLNKRTHHLEFAYTPHVTIDMAVYSQHQQQQQQRQQITHTQVSIRTSNIKPAASSLDDATRFIVGLLEQDRILAHLVGPKRDDVLALLIANKAPMPGVSFTPTVQVFALPSSISTGASNAAAAAASVSAATVTPGGPVSLSSSSNLSAAASGSGTFTTSSLTLSSSSSAFPAPAVKKSLLDHVQALSPLVVAGWPSPRLGNSVVACLASFHDATLPEEQHQAFIKMLQTIPNVLVVERPVCSIFTLNLHHLLRRTYVVAEPTHVSSLVDLLRGKWLTATSSVSTSSSSPTSPLNASSEWVLVDSSPSAFSYLKVASLVEMYTVSCTDPTAGSTLVLEHKIEKRFSVPHPSTLLDDDQDLVLRVQAFDQLKARRLALGGISLLTESLSTTSLELSLPRLESSADLVDKTLAMLFEFETPDCYFVNFVSANSCVLAQVAGHSSSSLSTAVAAAAAVTESEESTTLAGHAVFLYLVRRSDAQPSHSLSHLANKIKHVYARQMAPLVLHRLAANLPVSSEQTRFAETGCRTLSTDFDATLLHALFSTVEPPQRLEALMAQFNAHFTSLLSTTGLNAVPGRTGLFHKEEAFFRIMVRRNQLDVLVGEGNLAQLLMEKKPVELKIRLLAFVPHVNTMPTRHMSSLERGLGELLSSTCLSLTSTAPMCLQIMRAFPDTVLVQSVELISFPDDARHSFFGELVHNPFLQVPPEAALAVGEQYTFAFRHCRIHVLVQPGQCTLRVASFVLGTPADVVFELCLAAVEWSCQRLTTRRLLDLVFASRRMPPELDCARLPTQRKLEFDLGTRVQPKSAVTEIETCLEKFRLYESDLFVYRDAQHSLLLLKVDSEDASVLMMAVDEISPIVVAEITSLIQSRLDSFAVNALADAMRRGDAILDEHDAKVLFSQRTPDWSLALPCECTLGMLEAIKSALPSCVPGLLPLTLTCKTNSDASDLETVFHNGEGAASLMVFVVRLLSLHSVGPSGAANAVADLSVWLPSRDAPASRFAALPDAFAAALRLANARVVFEHQLTSEPLTLDRARVALLWSTACSAWTCHSKPHLLPGWGVPVLFKHVAKWALTRGNVALACVVSGVTGSSTGLIPLALSGNDEIASSHPGPSASSSLDEYLIIVSSSIHRFDPSWPPIYSNSPLLSRSNSASEAPLAFLVKIDQAHLHLVFCNSASDAAERVLASSDRMLGWFSERAKVLSNGFARRLACCEGSLAYQGPPVPFTSGAITAANNASSSSSSSSSLTGVVGGGSGESSSGQSGSMIPSSWSSGWMSHHSRTSRKGISDDSERLQELSAMVAQAHLVSKCVVTDLRLDVLCKDADDLGVLLERLTAQCGRLLADEFRMRRVYEAKRQDKSWFLAWFAPVDGSHHLLASIHVTSHEVFFTMSVLSDAARPGDGAHPALAKAVMSIHATLRAIAHQAISMRTELIVRALFANRLDPITCATALEFGKFAQSSPTSFVTTRRVLVLEGHIPQASIDVWTQTCLLANPTLHQVTHHDSTMMVLDQDAVIVIMLVVMASESLVEVDMCVASTVVAAADKIIAQGEVVATDAFASTLTGVEWAVFWKRASTSSVKMEVKILSYRVPVVSLDERFGYFLGNPHFPWRKFLPYLAANLRGASLICWDEDKNALLIGTTPVCAALVFAGLPPSMEICFRPLPIGVADLERIRGFLSALLDCMAGFSLEMCASVLRDRFSLFAPLLESGSTEG